MEYFNKAYESIDNKEVYFKDNLDRPQETSKNPPPTHKTY